MIAPKFWPKRIPEEFRGNGWAVASAHSKQTRRTVTETYVLSRVIGRRIGDDRRFLGVAIQAALTENC